MTTVGQGTPYNSVFGRQPALLPSLEMPDEPPGDSADGRKEARVREISIESMIQTTSMARTVRAIDAKTSPSGHDRYRPGDLVDANRHSGNKDVSSWRGPITVVKNNPDEGQVICRMHGRDRPCRYQDVRHSLLTVFTFVEGFLNVPGGAHKLVVEYIEHMRPGSSELFGLTADRLGKMMPTAASTNKPRIMTALQFMISNNLMLEDVVSVRLGFGVKASIRSPTLKAACYIGGSVAMHMTYKSMLRNTPVWT